MDTAYKRLTIRNDENLAPYVVEATCTGNKLGTGSYGSVEEVLVKGLPYAGKKIHEPLLDAANAGVENIIRKYVQECQLMSGLRHPNITLFVGVCFLPESTLPVLVMERLDRNLDSLLETIPNIPLPLKRSMLEDVATGLVYLHQHSPQIIHRDLTAKNVLLTTYYTAKITDFGNSRIVNLQPGQLARTMSQLPGTWMYMPPEALETSSRYGPSLDMFSFGHLALFVALQVFPGDLLHHTYPDPDNPDKLVGRSEIDRRQAYFDLLQKNLQGGQHPFVQFIKDCLHTLPSKRPTAEKLVTLLKEMKADIEGPYGELAKLDAIKQVTTMRALKRKDVEVRERINELTAKENEIQRLCLQLEQQQKVHTAEILSKDKELHEIQQKLTTEIQKKEAQIEQFGSQQQAPSVQLKFLWRKGQKMRFKLSSYPQVVVVKGKVFFRGAHLRPDKNSESMTDHQTVLVYDPQADNWSELPPYAFSWFAMTVLNDQLLVVGGQALTREKTDLLGMWDENQRTWIHPLPPMLKACNSPMVVTYKNRWLVVAGGFEGSQHLSVVQVLDVNSREWFYGSPLPAPISHVSTATIGNMFYLVGGFKTKGANVVAPNDQVLCVCLPDLILHAIAQDVSLDPSSCSVVWQSLPRLFANPYSTAVAVNETLLAVGGIFGSSSDIHLYQHSTKKWLKVGELPIGRSQCACAVLPSGEIFVAGGDARGSEQRVDIAQVVFNSV